MILRRLLAIFVLLIIVGAGQTFTTLVLADNTTQQFEEITDEIAPALILVNEIQSTSNKLLFEAVSVTLFLGVSDEDIELDIDRLREANVAYQSDNDSNTRDDDSDELPVDDDDDDDTEESIEDSILEEFVELEDNIELVHRQIVELDALVSDIDNVNFDSEHFHNVVTNAVLSAISLIEIALETDDDEEIAEGKEALEQSEDAIEDEINAFLTAEQQQLLVVRDSAQNSADRFSNQSFLALVTSVGVILIVMALIWHWIMRPINNLTGIAQRIASGKFNMTIEQKSSGEIGSLEQALHRMLDAIQQRDANTLELNEQLETQLVEVEQARAEAEKSSQVKSAFLASMSHELRTPLNAIINFTKFVAQGDLGEVNEEQQETLFEVVDSGKHLLHLINDVLDMSKIESGSLNLFMQEDVDVRDIITTVVKNGEALVGDKELELRTNIPDDLPLIHADQLRIRQIITNLVSNAIKFTEKGFVEIRASRTGKEISISVQDTGAGIDAGDHELIFDAFKQTEQGIATGGGSGLGLAISKRLVEIHGGTIRVESEAGQGATFHVTLPVKI